MSRIGKKPVAIPTGIEIEVNNSILTAKKGSLSLDVNFYNKVSIEVENNEIKVIPNGDQKEDKAFWGTYRSLISNAIDGLQNKYTKTLEINGVGYKAAVKGKILEMQLGYSHPILYTIPDGIDIEVDKNQVKISGINKHMVGQSAANIRKYRKPEPYKGKGIKYIDEIIIRKAGKTASK